MHSCPGLHDTLTTEHVQTRSSLHHCLSSSLKYWKCLPHYSAFAFFLPPPIWSLTPPLHLSEGVNEGRGHPSSPPPLLLNWMLVASVDICWQLSPPALQSQCADLLLICGISDSPTTGLLIQEEQEGNPHYKLCQGHRSHHTNLQASAQTCTYILFTSIATNTLRKKSVIRMKQHFHNYNSERWRKSLQFTAPRQKLTN